MRKLGDRVRLRSGETCELAHRDVGPKGALIWRLKCLSGHWTGYLGLTAAELERNAV